MEKFQCVNHIFAGCRTTKSKLTWCIAWCGPSSDATILTVAILNFRFQRRRYLIQLASDGVFRAAEGGVRFDYLDAR